MLQNSTLSVFIFLLVFAACKKEEMPKYVQFSVDFFLEHPDYLYIPPTFENVSEQFLIKEAHRSEGATFEIDFKTVLVNDAYQKYVLSDSTTVAVVQNAETNKAINLTCYEFFQDVELNLIDVPAEYKTILIQKVVDPGTGDEVPAQYNLQNYRILDTPAELKLRTNEPQAFKQLTFVIPLEEDIEDYIQEQLSDLTQMQCEAGRSYRILN